MTVLVRVQRAGPFVAELNDLDSPRWLGREENDLVIFDTRTQ
ncbi:hypothetical protein [Microbacterium sp.]|nr:hypothetical protein [Microbacterium sp.]